MATAALEYFPPNPYVHKNPGPTYLPSKNEKFKKSDASQPPPFYVPFPKSPGGQHAGCFDKFPAPLNDPYEAKIKDQSSNKIDSQFKTGGPNLRSKYTNSIINQVTKVSCHAKNYREYRERVYPLPQ